MSEATEVKVTTAKAGKPPKTASTQDINVVRKFLKGSIERKFGTMTAYANKKGKSLQYVSNVLHGGKAVPDWMLKDFKITHVVAEHWEVSAP